MDFIESVADAAQHVSDTIQNFSGAFDAIPDNPFTFLSGMFGVTLNITLMSMLMNSLSKDRPFPKTKKLLKESYDYIIVGGGTAGSVMANRLSQKPCVDVLLLEAGAEAPLFTEIPAAAILMYKSKIDWLYKSEPQKRCARALKDRRLYLNNGKALGGSSVLNAMLNVRGNWRDYDEWEAEGATGWNYENVLPFFKKLEDNKNIEDLDSDYHGTGGPMTVERINYIPPIKEPLLEATANMGYIKRDINGISQSGIFDVQATVRNQRRCSTAKAYLIPAEDRPNLDIVKNAFVRKIIIENNVAVGVEVDYLQKTRKVRAFQEVIVSNGALRTPQLLMLSGIGPSEELKKFNIPVVADLPVGENLMDHVASSLVYQVNDTIPQVFLNGINPKNIANYFLFKKGPLTAPNQVSLLAFLDNMNNTSDFPKQELYLCEFATLHARLNYNLEDEVYEKYFSDYKLKSLYICYSSILRPKSRGKITLRSKDPHEYPKIDPNYYEDGDDLKVVVEGMKICNAISKHPIMQRVQARPLDNDFPGCEQHKGDEVKYFTCIAEHLTQTFWHYCGTARMGRKCDFRSVVDPQLRVIGVRNLRVVNAAVMPTIPSANTNVPTMMIAEKAYAMMENDIQCSRKRKVVIPKPDRYWPFRKQCSKLRKYRK